MMEVKKNPKKDLNKSSSVFFAAAMAMVLALSYVALEWKSFYSDTYDQTAMTIDDDLDEPLALFKLAPPPPPPPVVPDAIEIVEDDPEIEETIIQSTESDPEKEVIEVSDIPDIDIPEDVDVPFILVENAPIFPGCENASDKRTCFNTEILKHIRKTFRYPEIAQEMGIQGKVYMHFIIQKDGNIGDVQIARSPDKNLGAEGKRIISKLPKMTPGKQRGNPVRVPFSIPINFVLQ